MTRRRKLQPEAPTNRSTKGTARTTGALAIAGGAAFAALAALEVTHPHIHEVSVKTPAEHAILALFAAGMLLIAPAFFTLAQFGSRLAPAKAAAAGLVLLALGSTYANIQGGDPEWFNALAGATNLLWLGGSIWLAFNLYRNSNLHKAIPLLLPIIWATTILGARIGGGVISGLYWVVVGATLVWTARTSRTADPLPAVAGHPRGRDREHAGPPAEPTRAIPTRSGRLSKSDPG